MTRSQLLSVLDANGLAAVRDACRLIEKRGYHRDRDLQAELERARREFTES